MKAYTCNLHPKASVDSGISTQLLFCSLRFLKKWTYFSDSSERNYQ